MDGLVVINKEKGYTSRDIDNILKNLLNEKVGHTGTLDPNATGVLICLIGKGTKYNDFFNEGKKEYEAEMIFGIETNTEDITGEIEIDVRDQIENNQIKLPNLEELNKLLSDFVGEQIQTPPKFSAKRLNGIRYYDLARKNIEFERKNINITIYSIYAKKKYKIIVSCSKGTYIRTLVKDIGKKLNIPATMGNLKRISINDYNINEAYKINTIKEMINKNDYSFVKPCLFSKDDTIVTFGKFDALHIGHVKIMKEMKKISKKDHLKSFVLAFDMSKSHITSIGEKIQRIKELGIDNVKDITLDKIFMNYDANFFVEEILIKNLKAKAIIVGDDCSFGKNAKGDINLLKQICDKYNIKLYIINKEKIKINNEKHIISSSLIRNCILDGDIVNANKMLNRIYYLNGRIKFVEKKHFSFEKNNEKIIPLSGYYHVIIIKNDIKLDAVCYISKNKQIDIFTKYTNLKMCTKLLDQNIQLKFIQKIEI
ncbi:MAG: tRNA pseudouridine(55) synthase TruB [Eubacteriales bacterium]|nr:tRNA pseudouridine(55) synthase TruB [Eubacteriales bacterium]